MEIILAQITEQHGFLPTRGSFMLDFVFVAMIAIIPVMTWSIVYLARIRHMYELHKRVQIALALVLLVAVVLFELDVRFFTDWDGAPGGRGRRPQGAGVVGRGATRTPRFDASRAAHVAQTAARARAATRRRTQQGKGDADH